MQYHHWPQKIAPMALALLLGGCAAFPSTTDVRPPSSEVVDGLDKKWASLPAVRNVASDTGISIRRVAPLPVSIGSKHLNFKLSAKASLDDIAGAMAAQGIRVALKVTSEKAAETLRIPNFNGSLLDFLDSLSVAHDLNYEYAQGVILISPGVRHMVVLPQYVELLKRVPAGLEGLGAKNVKADIDTGLVTFDASLAASADAALFIERIANNASMVSLQVAVIDVRLNRDMGQGFDWNEFSAKWGSLIDASVAATSPVAAVAAGATAVANAATTLAIKAATRARGGMATLSGGGLGFKLDENKFSLVAAVKLLSKYGKAQTDQDVLISTLSGAPVKISSGSQIPYVSGIGAVASQGGAVTGSVSTASVESGINIDITPHYDERDNLVITNVKARLSSLVRFRELSAGITAGTISQPEIQKLEFENLSRMRPGEVIMLGGITYDQISEDYSSIAGAEDKAVGSKSLVSNRHAIFIVIRPSVTVFKQQPESIIVAEPTLPHHGLAGGVFSEN